MNQKYLYVVLMCNRRPVSKEIVLEHIEYLKKLETIEKLVICGPCVDYQGGIVVLKARDLEEAQNLAKKDPFIAKGFKNYEIRTMEWAHKDNNYGLD